MCLEGENAVLLNREIMGATDPAKAAPGTLRKDFADNIEANAVHGSDSPKSAERELAYFFDKADIQKRFEESVLIALAQIDPVVGSFASNVKNILEAYERACESKARLLLTPELSVCGYPPYDLLDRPESSSANESALSELAAATKGKSCALVVGHVARNPSKVGRSAQNCASVLENGKEVFRQAKMLLPTYDVFDESRYFEPADKIEFWSCDGAKIALAICEDLWGHDPAFGRQLYGRDPIQEYCKGNPDLIVSISSSPYVMSKLQHREELHAEAAKKLKCPLIYVNQMGATDEILFDGASFALDAAGKLVGRLPVFRTSFGVVEFEKGKTSWSAPSERNGDGREDEPPKTSKFFIAASSWELGNISSVRVSRRPSSGSRVESIRLWSRLLRSMPWVRRMCSVSACRVSTLRVTVSRMPRRSRERLGFRSK